ARSRSRRMPKRRGDTQRTTWVALSRLVVLCRALARPVILTQRSASDRTAAIVAGRIQSGRWPRVQRVRQENAGKAHALNNALKNYATGEIVMCLDADSTIRRDALLPAVPYFRDPNVVALVANVKIRRDGSLLSLIQHYEYIIGWQMKRALSV